MTDPLLEELRERFRETARVRVGEMHALLEALTRDAADAEAVHRLSRHFHALAGLGATYGFRLVSELGDEAEGSILPFARSGEPPPRNVIARWREIVARIESDLCEEGARVDINVPRGAAPARRILAIEDDATHAVLIEHILKTAGYEVLVCSDPRQFDEALAGFHPDLLLADVQLEENVSGYDLVRRARTHPRFRSLPVIFVTGERDRGAEVGTTPAGDPLVPKPVDWDALLDLIASRVA
jgi:CheY-like chemotaxis protein